MNDVKIKIHWLVPLVILLILLLNCWVCWAQWGKFIFIGSIALVVTIIFLLSIFWSSSLAAVLFEEARLSNMVSAIFIPGDRLLKADYERAQKGPTGSRVSLNSVLTIEELSTYLKIPKSTLYKLVREGKIPFQKIGRHLRFHRETIDEWLRNSGQLRGKG